MRRRPVIAVIGSGHADEKVNALAEDLGGRIARAGCHLVCGGRGGVMAAACRGHRAARHEESSQVLSIGVLPGDDRSEANEWVDLALPTGIGLARNAIVVGCADGVIAVAGGAGTLSELAYAWQLGKPVAALRPSGGWSAELAGRRLDGTREDQVFAATDAVAAIAYIFEALKLDRETC